MLKNYLTVALRNLLRYKTYSAINIAGLVVGLVCVTLMLLYIQDEWAFDSQHTHRDRIYRVIRELNKGENSTFSYRTSGPLARAIQSDYPEAKYAVRTFWQKTFIRYNDTRLFLDYSHSTPEIVNVFTISFLKGDPQTALQQPNSAIITATTANRLFGDEDPIGKQVTVDKPTRGTPDLTITGIVKDFLPNNSYHFDILTTTPENDRYKDSWISVTSYLPYETWVLLRLDADAKTFETHLQSIFERYMGKEVADTNAYRLQAFNRIHLYSAHDFGIRNYLNQDAGRATFGDISQIQMLSLIAIFVLFIACINFINLTTSRAIYRANEVGVRKVLGADRTRLIRQFFTETMVTVLLSCLIAYGLLELLLPYFNGFVNKSLTLSPHSNIALWVWGPFIVLCVGTLSGCIPALYLSKFQPAQVLSGKSATGAQSTSALRKGLVIFQFGLATMLIVSTLTVHRQLKYMQEKDLGFDKEFVIELDLFWQARDFYRGEESFELRYLDIKNSFTKHPNILAATGMRFAQDRPAPLQTYKAEGTEAVLRFGQFDIDESYIDFFDMDIAIGRNLAVEDRYISQGEPIRYMLNETAAKQIGWDHPLGKQLGRINQLDGVVVGVIKDFHLGSLHHTIAPLVFRQGQMKFLYLKIAPANVQETLQFIETTWKRWLPQRPFTYAFLNHKLDRINYAKEIQLGTVYTTFSLLAILVSCMGLIGLVSFMAEQRTKEIGVRKILGASESKILGLFLKDFILLVAISNLVAWPLAYYSANAWLQTFVYRTYLDISVFAIAGVLTLLVAALTVGIIALKAARTNPVDALRYE